MPEVIFSGPAGRVEARYGESKTENAPIALILHGHPRAGGSMQDRVSVQLFQIFQRFSCCHLMICGISAGQSL